MQTLLNFAHPLSEKATKQIEEEIGEFIKEIRVTCQLDLNGKSLDAQIADIEASTDIRLMQADLIIAPAFAAGAYLLAAGHLVSGSDHRPRLVWMKNAGGTPPEFILGGIE